MPIIDTTINRISRNPKTSSAGKPYISLGLQVAEYGEKWLNGFGNKGNESWKVGDEVKINVIEKKVGENTYLNFEMVKLDDILLERVKTLEGQMSKLRPMYQAWKAKDDKKTSEGKPVPFPDEINPADIPF